MPILLTATYNSRNGGGVAVQPGPAAALRRRVHDVVIAATPEPLIGA